MRAGDRVRVQEPHELAGMTGDVSSCSDFWGLANVYMYAWGGKERGFHYRELTVINDELPMSLSEARFRARVARVRREMGTAA